MKGFDNGTGDSKRETLCAEVEVGVTFVDAEKDVGFEKGLSKSWAGVSSVEDWIIVGWFHRQCLHDGCVVFGAESF